ncbi:MAG: D-glycero-beta-D-manno-heptose 1-phosphate adenylyltransferase [Gemmatimonadaceae bacterium]
MIERNPREKICTWDEAITWRRGQPGTVVFTNGVFDLLHPGHVDLLLAARALGDALIVGMNSDASVQRLKGPTRPVRSALDRAYVLAALSPVDAVVFFEQDTPLELVRALEPDVLVKGGDYRESTIVGADDVRRRGGRVVVIPLTPGHSTTFTVKRMQGAVSNAP